MFEPTQQQRDEARRRMQADMGAPVSTGLLSVIRRYWRNRWNYYPVFHLLIEIPFVRIRTILMGQAMERMTREYIILDVQVFKWKFQFELYDTMQRVRNR